MNSRDKGKRGELAPAGARPRPSGIEPLPRDLAASDPEPLAVASAGDLAGECLRRLPPTQRALVADLLAGWSLTEAAERFGIAVAAASEHLRRARCHCAPLFACPAGRLPRARGRGGSDRGTRGGGLRQEAS
jgi:DNA-directed RNA polymerase specialized sigma24 family protein